MRALNTGSRMWEDKPVYTSEWRDGGMNGGGEEGGEEKEEKARERGGKLQIIRIDLTLT